MSESADNLHVFYRFTVPGITFTTWIFLMLPSTFVLGVSRNSGSATLFISFLLGSSVVIGWLSYYSIYPIWKRIMTSQPFRSLRIYPESQMYVELSKELRRRKIAMKAEYLWSYFLWNYCSEPIRQRVKNLADYGHSLYLVSSAFIGMTVLYVIARLLRGPYSMFTWLTGNLLGLSGASEALGELTILVPSVLLGFYLLLRGRERIEYAQSLQQVLYQEQHQKLEQVLDTLTPAPEIR